MFGDMPRHTEEVMVMCDHAEPLVEEPDAAALAHETGRSFRNRRYNGTGPPFIKVGRKVLYRRRAVLDWLLEHEVPSGTAA